MSLTVMASQEIIIIAEDISYGVLTGDISVKRIRYAFSTSFYDSYSEITTNYKLIYYIIYL